MTDSALFIGWGTAAAGREKQAVEHFTESLRYLTGLVTEGTIASVEPFFLEPHGGDLWGFFIVRGESEQLHRIRDTHEFQRLMIRSQLLVNDFGIVRAITGRRLNRYMLTTAEAATEIDPGGSAKG